MSWESILKKPFDVREKDAKRRNMPINTVKQMLTKYLDPYFNQALVVQNVRVKIKDIKYGRWQREKDEWDAMTREEQNNKYHSRIKPNKKEYLAEKQITIHLQDLEMWPTPVQKLLRTITKEELEKLYNVNITHLSNKAQSNFNLRFRLIVPTWEKREGYSP